MRIRFLIVFAVLVGGLTTFEFGCRTMLDSVVRNPERYVERELTVTGRVGRMISIPMSGFSAYMLDDGESGLPVFSSRHRAEGRSVVVRGFILPYDADGGQDRNAKTLDAVAAFLIENSDVAEDLAPGMAKGVVGAVWRVSRPAGRFYFLLEK